MKVSASCLKNAVMGAYICTHAYSYLLCTLGTAYYLQLWMLQRIIAALTDTDSELLSNNTIILNSSTFQPGGLCRLLTYMM